MATGALSLRAAGAQIGRLLAPDGVLGWRCRNVDLQTAAENKVMDWSRKQPPLRTESATWRRSIPPSLRRLARQLCLHVAQARSFEECGGGPLTATHRTAAGCWRQAIWTANELRRRFAGAPYPRLLADVMAQTEAAARAYDLSIDQC